MKSMVIAFVLIPFHLVTLTPLSAQTAQNYDQFFLEAMVQRQKGNHDAAFDLLRHCRDLNPEAPEVYYYLGQYYGAIKDSERSMACVKKAAELDPDNMTYMETLAQAYISQRDYASAIPVIEGNARDAVSIVSAGGGL